MTFLYNKEKYGQVLDYGEKAIARMLDDANFTRSTESDNALNIYLASANKIPSEEILDRARKLLISYKLKLDTRRDIGSGKLRLKQVMLFHLLCVKNNKFAEALEAVSEFHTPHFEYLNAKAILFARLGRMDDCLFAIDSILNDTRDKLKFVFTETVSDRFEDSLFELANSN